MPVKVPGPTVAAIPSSDENAMPEFSMTPRTMGPIASAWPVDIGWKAAARTFCISAL